MHGVPHTFDSPRDCAQFRTLPHRPGVELYRAHIVHYAFAPHTHDAYGFGAIAHGVERFRYRGGEHLAPPDAVVMMQPDALHTGQAETADGWGYQMAYIEPALLAELSGEPDWWFAEAVDLTDPARGRSLSQLLTASEPLACDGLLALGAVACWTWYPIRNANWLRAHPDRPPRAWATAQGLATLPLAALGYLGFIGWQTLQGGAFPLPFGPRPLFFVGLMLAIGLLASWLGTLCWNEASQRLPTALVGQLIVFETLSALAYAYWLRGAWPPPLTLLGIALLLLGVLAATRVKPVKPAPITS